MDQFITPEHIETLIKLLIALILGMMLGLERLYAHKNAGMRTYALVTLAAAFFVAISESVGFSSFLGADGTDRMRIASQIVVGVGFLGGGLIIFKDDKISNLTTAAGLWVAAAIGVAVGFGLYIEALFATLLTLFVLYVLARVEYIFKVNMKQTEATEKNKKTK